MFELADRQPVGQTILAAIRATRAVVDSNTNLGIVLLLAPLAAVPRSRSLREGVAAVLNSKGALVGKTTFPVQRLLPGERLEFKAEYPDQLEPGSYKVLCSFQFEGKTLTTDGSFTVR